MSATATKPMPGVTLLHANLEYSDKVRRCQYCAKPESEQGSLEPCDGPLPLRKALVEISGIVSKWMRSERDGIPMTQIMRIADKSLGEEEVKGTPVGCLAVPISPMCNWGDNHDEEQEL